MFMLGLLRVMMRRFGKNVQVVALALKLASSSFLKVIKL